MQSSLENAHKSCPSIFPGQPCRERGEGRVRGADVPVRGAAHLTLPLRGPLPLPPEGRRGLLAPVSVEWDGGLATAFSSPDSPAARGEGNGWGLGPPLRSAGEGWRDWARTEPQPCIELNVTLTRHLQRISSKNSCKGCGPRESTTIVPTLLRTASGTPCPLPPAHTNHAPHHGALEARSSER